jgi:hypothetical protein
MRKPFSIQYSTINLLRIASYLTFVCCGALTSVQAREQITIQKGTSGNTQLRGYSTYLDQQNPNTSNSGGNLQVRSTTNQLQRTLVLFDLSVVPNAGIKSASLTLHVLTAPSSTRTYGAYLMSDFWTTGSSWNNRASGVNGTTTAWNAAGGDFNGTATNTQSVTKTATTVSFDITADVQSWYNGTANFGTLIKDQNEGTGTVTTIFNSFSDATTASRPSLTLTFLQNVQNLTSTPASGSVTLNWTYPTAIGTVLTNEAYAGVVILRRAGAPVDKSSAPTDGQAAPALCSTVGSGTVVFVGTMSNTSFVDNNTCGGMTNGTQYFYKAFMRDAANYYTSNPAGLASPRDGSSTFTAETAAVPGSDQTTAWTIGTHSPNLGAPGLVPGAQVDFGSDTEMLFSMNASTGQRAYPPVGLGGVVSARPPILDSSISANSLQVAYVTAQDGYVYAIDTSTGAISWMTNLSQVGATGNVFMGGAGVQVRQYSSSGYTSAFTTDTVWVGTHNTGAGGTNPSTTANSIIALNGSTGAIVYTITGGAGGVPSMDQINSTPTIDYANNAVWVTSRSNGGTGQPNLWKINPLTGKVLWSVNLGSAGDIDSCPTITQYGDVMFVGTNSGMLYAINPAATTAGTAVLGSYNANDGAIRSYPFVVDAFSPFRMVFTTSTKVQAVSFNKSTNTFTALWGSPPTLTSPSAPVVNIVTGKVYVGTGATSDLLYELNFADGSTSNTRVVDTGNNPMYIGDPALDLVLNRVYITTYNPNDQRSYAYSIPF